MEIISRHEARSQGRRLYFTGLACVNGHIAERLVSKSDCLDCRRERKKMWARANMGYVCEKSRAWYAANTTRAKETRENYRKRNPERVRGFIASYQAANKERLKAAQKVWAKNNWDKVLGYAAKTRAKHHDRLLERDRAWRAANKDKVNAKKARRLASQIRATPSWADLKKIAVIYRQAYELTKATGIEHHVDHVVPLRSKWVCGLHCEHNLQVLPGPENRAKSNIRWPGMPDHVGRGHHKWQELP